MSNYLKKLGTNVKVIRSMSSENLYGKRNSIADHIVRLLNMLEDEKERCAKIADWMGEPVIADRIREDK